MRAFLSLVLAIMAVWSPSATEQQKNAWVPPTSAVPAAYSAEAKKLLEAGLFGDPRGGRYSLVRVLQRTAAWGSNQAVEVYGWVLPKVGKAAPHVVLWDGIEYSGCEVLKDADLDATLPAPNTQQYEYANFAAPAPGVGTAAAALLLLVGKTGAAEEAYNRDKGRAPDPSYRVVSDLADKYKLLAADALKHSWDAEGLVWSKSLVRTVELLLKLPPEDFMEHWRLEYQEHDLLSDFERRVLRGYKNEPDASLLAGVPLDKQVGVLIDNLDELGVDQFGQPGGVVISWSPLVNALTKIGSPAVPALIDCYEKDERLTRSVSFGRDFFIQRHVLTVRDAANSALGQIWPASAAYAGKDPSERAKVLRQEWAKSQSLSEPERQLAVLEDDRLSRRAWLDSAQFLTRPPLGSKPTDHPRQLQGDAIRSVSGERVTNAMALRALGMSAFKREGSTLDLNVIADADSMGMLLFKWAPSQSKATLRKLADTSIAEATQWTDSNSVYFHQIVGPGYVSVLSALMTLGDSDARHEYESYLQSVEPDYDLIALYRPLAQFPKDLDLQAWGSTYFSKAMGRIETKTAEERNQLAQFVFQLVDTPLMLSPAFRGLLDQRLTLEDEPGSAWLERTTQNVLLHYEVSGGSGSMGVIGDFADKEPMGVKVQVMSRDMVAQQISHLEGAPPYLMTWPELKRKAARGRMIAWLRSGKILFKESWRWSRLGDFDPEG